LPRKCSQRQKHQHRIKELKAQYDDLERKLAEVKSGETGKDNSDTKGSNAGTAFGGRASMGNGRKPA
jgi:hypothetical protein